MSADDRQKIALEEQRKKEAILSEYPEIGKLDQAKKKVTRFLIWYMLICRIVSITIAIQTRGGRLNPMIWIVIGLGGFFIYVAFLSFCMGGGAHHAYCLHLILVNIAYSIYKSLKGITSFEMLIEGHKYLLQTDLLASLSYFLSYIAFALHMGVIVWLVMVPKNLRLARQYDALMKNGGAGQHSSSIRTMAKWTSDDEKEE